MLSRIRNAFFGKPPSGHTTVEELDMGEVPSQKEPEVHPDWDYATKKTIVSGMLNVTLLLSNAAQLKSLYGEDEGSRHDLWTTQVTFIIISIALQVMVAFLLFVLSLLKPTKEHHKTSVYVLNNTASFIILIICIINVIISGFGIHMDDNPKPVNASHVAKH